MEETPETKRHIEVKRGKPRFLEEVRTFTGAEKGSITHKVLGCVDYSLVKAGNLEKALNQLLEKGLVTQKEMSSIQKNHLISFFSSDLGKRVLSSVRAEREWPFNMRISGGTLLQGVIDLCFLEQGEWILVDYKTDHLLPEDLLAHYSKQINWYRTALEKITNFKVREMFLFSLPLGKAIPVNKIDTEL